MTILNVASPLTPVRDDALSGASAAEQVLSFLDEGLDRAGHRSIVIAPTGSICAGTLLEMPRLTGKHDEAALRKLQHAYQRTIEWALDHYAIDVVHFHGADFHNYLPAPASSRTNVPTLLATLHLPPDAYAPEIFEDAHPELLLHCVSEAQELQCPSTGKLIAAVPSGVAMDRLWPVRRKRDFALVWGRIHPQSGFDRALEAAHRADANLVIVGQVGDAPEDQQYFETEIAPRLDAKRRLLKPHKLTSARKRRLLAAARCVINPALSHEASSLLTMEALACGTPVIAQRTAEWPDVIEHGHTGYLVEDVEEMAEALRHTDSFSPETCRREALRRFPAPDMVRRYISLYERHRAQRGSVTRISTIPLPALQPREITTLDQLKLLERSWNELHDGCPQATPFQSPAWLLPWCEHFGVKHMRTLAMYQGTTLVGLVPMLIYRDQGARVLTLLGSGVSDYQDGLFHPAYTRAALACLRDWLWTQRADWDYCDFEQLRADSPLLELELSTLGAAHSTVQEACPILALGDTLEASVPVRLRRSLEHSWRMLEQAGRVRLEGATEANYEELLEGLIALHDKRSVERDKPGVFQDLRVEAFHRDASRRLLERGALRLYGLTVDEQLVAVFYGFADKSRVYYYLGGFDPAWAKYSPGGHVLAYAIERGILERAKEFDFLRGAEPYKYTWGAEDSFNHRYTLVQASERRSMPSGIRAVSR